MKVKFKTEKQLIKLGWVKKEKAAFRYLTKDHNPKGTDRQNQGREISRHLANKFLGKSVTIRYKYTLNGVPTYQIHECRDVRFLGECFVNFTDEKYEKAIINAKKLADKKRAEAKAFKKRNTIKVSQYRELSWDGKEFSAGCETISKVSMKKLIKFAQARM